MARRMTESNAAKDIERQINAEAKSRRTRNNRRHGRVVPDSLWCSAGEVLDLSASGLRLQCTKAVGAGVGKVVLRDRNHTVEVQGRVVWCKKVGFRRFEVGLEFVDIAPETAATIRAMAVFS